MNVGVATYRRGAGDCSLDRSFWCNGFALMSPRGKTELGGCFVAQFRLRNALISSAHWWNVTLFETPFFSRELIRTSP